MSSIFLANARIVDGSAPEPTAPQGVVIEGNRIREVGPGARAPAGATTIDLSGKVLMPGLIDCHVHVVAVEASLARNALLPDALVMARSMKLMGEMLMRGFTTVRDVGGAAHAQVVAWQEGLYRGPRLVISGKGLSQSGGHCDFRGPFDDTPPRFSTRLGSLGRLCDGVAEIRKAAREEIKGGARFVKIMANGGVASPTDPIHFLGFSREEILAVVEEARNAGTYVAAHLYTDEAIRRAVECGVHSLEHCNLIEEPTARLAAERGCIACPTLVTYDALSKEGEALGIGAESVAKVDDVRLAGMDSLRKMKAAGLPMAFGTDLLGPMHRHQSEEFVIRGRVLPAQEVIATATSVAAKLCRMEGQIGAVAPGAFADLIVVEGDPLRDLSLLTHQGRHIPLIMQDGAWVKGA
ncbi:metal-dependent hydrolase family protein [Paracraurococcus ruber]|uniref:Peptidase M38 n=1 Tax=Paracraurococcus ruber TaxID=77675 RepID=A0ABS1CUQ7_9PROT|nr:amidohydrolase family protein [Paracraurococcus ruber]MBK1658119.1 peptidase M38 [Paracraurococcus ruber]TDG29134.1 amidohydrolase family protein [Paracraurococcus ruber]